LGRHAGGDSFQQIRQGRFIYIILTVQGIQNSVHVFFREAPGVQAAGILPAARIGNIEHITDAGCFTGSVDQGNAFGTAPHITAHGVAPQPILRAGRSVRPLSEDHELLCIGVFVDTRSRGQERGPPLIAAGDLLRGLVSHLRVKLHFARHEPTSLQKNKPAG